MINERIEIIEDERVVKAETTADFGNGHLVIDYGNGTPLYNGDAKCHHEIVGGYNMSGIRCRKCNGWYCA